MRRLTLLLVSAFLLGILTSPEAAAASTTQQGKLTASDAAAFDGFGGAVAVSGNTAIVSAQGNDDAGSGSGAAYVFVRIGSGWSEQAKLTSDDAAAGDNFGFSVAASGDTVVVGAALADVGAASSAGAAYVFVRSGSSWSEQAKVTASDAAAADLFGSSVSISVDTAVIGAHLKTVGSNTTAGAAYVFVRSGSSWSEQAKLTASDAETNAQFGIGAAVDGDTTVLGAEYDDASATNSGAAYVFVRSGSSWSQQAKVTASDAVANDQFGHSVGISGDTLVTGAHRDDDGGSDSGSAYVFARSGTTWAQQAKLTADDAASLDNFGRSVALSGQTVVVGARLNDDAGTDSGSAYPFVVTRNVSFTQDAKLTASDGAAEDSFGSSVAINGDTAVVGAPLADPTIGSGPKDAAGAVYIFVRSSGLWSQQARLVSSSDTPKRDEFGGAVAISGETLVVGVAGEDNGGTDLGEARVFVRTGSSWSEQARLVASSRLSFDDFGISVAIDGNTAVIGAQGVNNAAPKSGAAYVFVRSGSTWTQQAKLTASDGGNTDLLGRIVAISGNTVVVGSRFDDLNSTTTDSGSAYVFVKPAGGWSDATEDAKLTASDGATADRFGGDIAINGDTVAVGVFHHAANSATDSGAVYVFVKPVAGWADATEDIKLTASDGAAGDNFGSSVAFAAGALLVGARGDNDAGTDAGSAYVFVGSQSSWNQQQKLTASDGAAGDLFGVAMAASGTTLVLGAFRDDDAGNDSGSAYVFAVEADLAVSKADSSDPVTVGDNLTYTVVVTNNGPSDATGVTLTDTLPSSVAFVSATLPQVTCSQASGIVACPLGSLINGASATVSVVVTTNSVETLTNNASVAGNNTATETTVVQAVATPTPVPATPTPTPTAVPGVSTWGLIGLAVLMAGAAFVMLRRRAREARPG